MRIPQNGIDLRRLGKNAVSWDARHAPSLRRIAQRGIATALVLPICKGGGASNTADAHHENAARKQIRLRENNLGTVSVSKCLWRFAHTHWQVFQKPGVDLNRKMWSQFRRKIMRDNAALTVTVKTWGRRFVASPTLRRTRRLGYLSATRCSENQCNRQVLKKQPRAPTCSPVCTRDHGKPKAETIRLMMASKKNH